MTGLDIARGYYEKFGKPMLESGFADVLPFLAVGFVGSGSEHYGSAVKGVSPCSSKLRMGY